MEPAVTVLGIPTEEVEKKVKNEGDRTAEASLEEIDNSFRSQEQKEHQKLQSLFNNTLSLAPPDAISERQAKFRSDYHLTEDEFGL